METEQTVAEELAEELSEEATEKFYVDFLSFYGMFRVSEIAGCVAREVAWSEQKELEWEAQWDAQWDAENAKNISYDEEWKPRQKRMARHNIRDEMGNPAYRVAVEAAGNMCLETIKCIHIRHSKKDYVMSAVKKAIEGSVYLAGREQTTTGGIVWAVCRAIISNYQEISEVVKTFASSELCSWPQVITAKKAASFCEQLMGKYVGDEIKAVVPVQLVNYLLSVQRQIQFLRNTTHYSELMKQHAALVARTSPFLPKNLYASLFEPEFKVEIHELLAPILPEVLLNIIFAYLVPRDEEVDHHRLGVMLAPR